MPPLVELEINRLCGRVFPLGRLLHGMALTLEAPEFFRSRDERGFRFQNPGLAHFCLLRGVRIVSALNAAIELARAGFPQEVCVLLRTVIEYSTQIDFMRINLDTNGNLSPEGSKFLSDYFADDRRTDDQSSRKAKLVQKKLHEIIGAHLDDVAGYEGKTPCGSDAVCSLSGLFELCARQISRIDGPLRRHAGAISSGRHEGDPKRQ